jgi:hypothetical protein
MTLTDYAIIAIAGFPGWLVLIGMAADWLQTRSVEDAPHDYTDGFCPVHLAVNSSERQRDNG